MTGTVWAGRTDEGLWGGAVCRGRVVIGGLRGEWGLFILGGSGVGLGVVRSCVYSITRALLFCLAYRCSTHDIAYFVVSVIN